MHVLVLVLVGQSVGKPTAQVGQQRGGQLRGTRVHAFHPVAGIAMVQVDAREMLRAGRVVAAAKAPVQAQRNLLEVVLAQAQLAFGEIVPIGGLGDVVDRATHGARAEQEARRAAYGLDPIVDPAVHGTRGDRILHADAVEHLPDGAAAKAPVAHADAAGRVVCGHTRNGAQDFLRVLGATRLDGGAVHHGDGCGRLARRQSQAAAGFDRGVQLDAAIGGGHGIHHLHGLQGGRLGGLVLRGGTQRGEGQACQQAGAQGRQGERRDVGACGGYARGCGQTGHENALGRTMQRQVRPMWAPPTR